MKQRMMGPPYGFLPYVVFTFFVICFALHPLSPFYTHQLADPDDLMRLNEVTGWLQGQSWYDLSVPRLSPGAHTVIHWSRLVDLPIALIALPFISHFGVTNAVLIASFIVPLLWFAVLLVLLRALAQNFMGRESAFLSSVMVLFAPMLLFNYTPGRVDHHGIQCIIAGFGLLSLCRILRDDKGSLFSILAAFTFACGFWIGTEALPWAILYIACLGCVSAWQGEKVARQGAIFGIFLTLFTAVLIPIALPFSEFSSRALSWFSPAYVIFAALSASILILGFWVCRVTNNKFLRLTVYGALGFCASFAFFVLVPSALQGPFTDYDAFDATIALDNISEAQPLLHAFHFNRYMPLTFVPVAITFVRLLLLPLIACVTCLGMVKKSREEMRLIWLAQAAFLIAATTLTLFWQMRVGIFMELFAVIPLTKLLCAWWDKLKWGLWDRPLFWAEMAAFLALGFAPVVLFPSLVAKTPLYPDIVLFPAARAAATCPLQPIIPFLNSLEGPWTIMNSSDTGPELLFATHHNVIAGNFDVAGNADAFAFFHATDDAQAEAAAAKWNATHVLICRTVPTMYLGKEYYNLDHVRLQAGPDGLLHLTNMDPHQPLIERLIRGQNPAWLKPIEIPTNSDYLLFEIQHTGKTPYIRF